MFLVGLGFIFICNSGESRKSIAGGLLLLLAEGFRFPSLADIGGVDSASLRIWTLGISNVVLLMVCDLYINFWQVCIIFWENWGILLRIMFGMVGYFTCNLPMSKLNVRFLVLITNAIKKYVPILWKMWGRYNLNSKKILYS